MKIFKEGVRKYYILLTVIFNLLLLAGMLNSASSVKENAKPYIYCSYFGGSEKDIITGMAIDSMGNVIVVGGTFSTDLTVLNGFQIEYGGGFSDNIHENGGDGFVAKFSPSGELIWGTYLGGNDLDCCNNVIIDSEDNILVIGKTISDNFPTTENALKKEFCGTTDGFISKFFSNGSLVYSTYIGEDGAENLVDLVEDKSGNIFIVGATGSSNFTTSSNAPQKIFGGGVFDTIILKLSHNLSDILFSTFLGGSEGDGGYNIALDYESNLIVTGFTLSNDFPLKNALQDEILGDQRDIFVIKINSTGQIIFSTYLGGSSIEDPFGLTVNASGSIIISGRTASDDYPTEKGLQNNYAGGVDAIISIISPDGQTLEYSTFLGGNGWDTLHQITVNSSNSVFACGIGSDYPTKNAFQEVVTGGSDIVIMQFSSEKQVEFSTYFGGSGSECPYSMKYYNNSLYIVGLTDSGSLFISDNAFQDDYKGNTDGFILMINIQSYLSSVSSSQNLNLSLVLTIVIPISLIAVTGTILLIWKYRRNT
ncbi:MAG: SBBP repeat-containing protein [Promethearchaeota archaeon]